MNRRQEFESSQYEKASGIRAGFTLMETMISIGLLTLLMAALYSAMSLYFNLQMDSHDEIERMQIARILLRQMTRDIHSVVFEEQETTEESSSSSSSSSSTEETAEPVAADPAKSMSAYSNGLVGTETDLLLYVSRPDKDLNYVTSQELKSFSDRSGDLMIIRYFTADRSSGGLSSDIASREGAGRGEGPAGLVRMAGDLYGLSMAIDENEDQSQMSAAKIFAKEVTSIRFQYFDGTAWQTEWDSTQLNLMPSAIEITVTLTTLAPSGSTQSDSDTEDPYRLPDSTHRMVVNIPVAKPYVAETAL